MKLFNSGSVLLAFLCLVQWSSCLASAVANEASIIRFEVTLTWEDWDVAGAVRKTILSNGQFPAPTLQLDQGDRVEFLVTNLLPFSTTVHFHGIDQQGTPWSDGVPGLSQEPIQPGRQFLYTWTASQYGSYFYHAHNRGQIEDGLYGAIYIRPGKSVKRPFDMITTEPSELHAIFEAERNTQPLILSDWRVLTSEQVWKAEEATGLDAFCANAILINGKGSIQCLSRDTISKYTTPAQKGVLGNYSLTDLACLPPIDSVEGDFARNVDAAPKGFYSGCTPSQGPTEQFEVDPNAGWVSWDIISPAGISVPMFSIDEHPMYVYAVDGRYIQPLQVDAVSVSNGVRYSILVKLDKPAGQYFIRAANFGLNQIINATAIMSYATPIKSQQGPSKPYINIVGANTTADTVIFDETKVIPFPVEIPSMHVDQTHFLKIDHYNASYRWILGNNSFPLDLKQREPLLFNHSAVPQGLTISTHNGTWVDLIMIVPQPIQPPHPIHKHSNKYFVIGQGEGPFPYSSVAEAAEHIPQNFNFKNPQIRDTFNTPPAAMGPTWLAIRYQVVNPGAFLLHCHIQVHLSGGMAIAILDGVDAWPQVPPEYQLPLALGSR